MSQANLVPGYPGTVRVCAGGTIWSWASGHEDGTTGVLAPGGTLSHDIVDGWFTRRQRQVAVVGRTLRVGPATNCQGSAAVKAIKTRPRHNTRQAGICGQLRQGRNRDLAETAQWA